MSDLLGIIGVVTGVAGAVTGVSSVLATRRSNRIAAEARAIAQDAHAIEQQREWRDLTPQFDITWLEPWGPDSLHAAIDIMLVGPNGVDQIEPVELFMRDDRDRSNANLRAGGPTQADIDRWVWGPYTFAGGIDLVKLGGKRYGPVRLTTGTPFRIQLDQLGQPPWVRDTSSADDWQLQYADHPVRLTLICATTLRPPWTVRVDVVRETGVVSHGLAREVPPGAVLGGERL